MQKVKQSPEMDRGNGPETELNPRKKRYNPKPLRLGGNIRALGREESQSLWEALEGETN